MSNLDNPRVGETVLFDCGGSTFAGRISRVHSNGTYIVEPEQPINRGFSIENVRRPTADMPVLTQEEQIALKVKTDGRYAQELFRKNRSLYDKANDIIRSGKLDRKHGRH